MGGSAQLVVARRSDDVADYIVATERSLATLNRSYQGVPSDANMYFSEIFDRFSGTDKPATIPFFLPYGSDLLKLWLTYEIGGMRATAKAALGGGGQTTSSGGGQTTSSGGSSTPTSSSGGSSTPTSSSVSTPSGGGDTSGSSGSTAATTQSAAGASSSIQRSGGTYDVWYEMAIKVPAGDYYEIAEIEVANFGGGTRSFSAECWTGAGGTGTQIGSAESISNVANGSYGRTSWWSVGSVLSSGVLYVRVKQTTNAACTFLAISTRSRYSQHSHTVDSHTHTTPAHTHPAHDHTVTIGNHTHTVTIAAHTHTVSNHTHTVSDHAHDLEYGIYESSAPTGLRVYVDDTLVTDLNDVLDISKVDLLPYVRKDSNGRVAEGRHTLSFTTPNDSETGGVRGTLYISKFLAIEAA